MEHNAESGWITPSTWPGLDSGQVHLWRIRLDGAEGEDERLWDFLSLEERERTARFHFSQHRGRFLRSHGILRAILSLYIGTPPSELPIDSAPGGKPFLSGLEEKISFNLSHSADWMALGISTGHELGVDVESGSRELDWRSIAREYFHPGEIQSISQLPDEGERLEAFFRVWTLKEAYLKAVGSGIAGGLNRVEVRLEPGAALDFVTLPGDEIKKRRWQVFSFQPVQGAFGSVVVERCEKELSLFRFHWAGLSRWIT